MSVTLNLKPQFRRAEAVNNIELPTSMSNLIESQHSHRRVLHSSISDADIQQFIHCSNRFVGTMIRAWHQHQHVVLRPDDVWLAILIQFRFSLGGKEPYLNIPQQSPILLQPNTNKDDKDDTITTPLMQLFHDKIQDNELAELILPSFSTSQLLDKSTAAIVFMGTGPIYNAPFNSYPGSYASITLQGTRNDWIDIISRINRLTTLNLKYPTPTRTPTSPGGGVDRGVSDTDTRGVQSSNNTDCEGEELLKWTQALVGIVEYMVATFDRPEDADVRNFWRLAHHPVYVMVDACSQSTMSGWLTAFCWWRSDGTKTKSLTYTELRDMQQARNHEPILKYGGVTLPIIYAYDIPTSYVELRVKPHPKDAEMGVDEAIFIAGSTVTKVIDNVNMKMQPYPSWWLLVGDKTAELERPAAPNRPPKPKRKLVTKYLPGQSVQKDTQIMELLREHAKNRAASALSSSSNEGRPRPAMGGG